MVGAVIRTIPTTGFLFSGSKMQAAFWVSLLDVIEQENRQRLSFIAHFRMVIVGYRGKYIDNNEKMHLFREYNTDNIFDLKKLRNHRNYEFVICHHENDFAVHIYDKETLWEVG